MTEPKRQEWTKRPIIVSRLTRLESALTPRDRVLLDCLAIVGVATTEQIARICCAGFTADTALRLARRSLQRLRRDGLVRRFDDRAWDRKVGAPGYVHALTTAGLKLIGGTHGVGLRHRTSWQPSYPFLTHRLAITELYVRLAEQERAGGPRMHEFAAEANAWRSYLGPSGERLVLRPDALVRLVWGELEVSHFVEVDKGTETRPATIADKCQAYRRYELSGVETRRHGVFPGVMFIVPDAKRAQAIGAVLVRQPADAQDLFMVATEDEALVALAPPQTGGNALPPGKPPR